ncbi:hypothetical protein ERO13_D06G108100v2 [Gossypium hirsutum]|uniref:Uncharacterized protein LOC107902018 n=1 Tax=Gossypium hirsutum TaxID=3635 RepID=A0A1U8J688_GOSHI|nr:uncharacterized protein LOC107902018 [Gossypium hirsutum]XP_016683725.1 uncharacterized protein LOC107902018 [Gossypium hirsutum]XP_016683726.1 uncharacterized protein LOC107902018 [Gossypium hirsutum]XP_016683727.1 uncharacterized protein LOC107902018 [Gossypium hirsutum]XP_016683728.1 uncharacterized protein LOC107902018 [Gossypium hirsutum]XP_016683729.1 uncharacterized protein LOC107902018 [Gossypium hirsutum]XP_040951368.1 uncharacterized protein LOC107902018 [Gossypium hirsutum]XP_0
MQSQQGSRIDLGELKAQIVKKIGAERSKRYFYNLSRFLSQKLSKCEFDKSCYCIIGRQNLSLHNQLIRSILKNACQAKTPPPGPVISLIQTVERSPGREDAHEVSGSLVPNHNQNADIWSNGVFPVSSPRKARSGIWDRKPRDRPSPLGPSGKAESVSHHSMGMEDNVSKLGIENGDLTPYDYQRPVQHLQAVAELPEIVRGLVHSAEKPRVPGKGQAVGAVVEDGQEVEQANQIDLSRSPLLAPLGIPFCSASVGGARKALAVAGSSDFISYYDSGGLYDIGTLKKRMEQIAAAQGLGGVSVECASMLNNMLDVYLKNLIRSCVDLVGSKSTHEVKKHSAYKSQPQGKLMNGMWPGNHLHMQSSSGPIEVLQEPGQCCLISLLDFKVAMELNPLQLGEDWPVLLEKICMHSFE